MPGSGLPARTAAVEGDRDEALRWLERAADPGWRGHPAGDIATDPLLDGPHEEPRFQRLMTRILDDVQRMRPQVEREG